MISILLVTPIEKFNLCYSSSLSQLPVASNWSWSLNLLPASLMEYRGSTPYLLRLIIQYLLALINFNILSLLWRTLSTYQMNGCSFSSLVVFAKSANYTGYDCLISLNLTQLNVPSFQSTRILQPLVIGLCLIVLALEQSNWILLQRELPSPFCVQ